MDTFWLVLGGFGLVYAFIVYKKKPAVKNRSRNRRGFMDGRTFQDKEEKDDKNS